MASDHRGRTRRTIMRPALLLTLSVFSPTWALQSPRLSVRFNRLQTGAVAFERADRRGRLSRRTSLLALTSEGGAEASSEIPTAEDSTKSAGVSSSEGEGGLKWSEVRARESDAFKWSVVQEREAEIKRLKFLLAETKEYIEDGERRKEEAERKLGELAKESEVERAVNKGLVAKVKAQFENEREKLVEQLRKFSDELLQAKEEAKEELARVKSEAEEKEASLETKVTDLESSLRNAEAYVDRTKKEAEQQKSEQRATLKREREEAERMVKSVTSTAFQEKRALEKENWDLETKLDKVNLELIAARRALDKAKANRAALEEELREKERSMQERMDELEQRIDADEMFRARSRQEMKEKLGSVALKFQRKLAEREAYFEREVESVRDEAARREAQLEKKAKDDRIALYMEKHAAVAESRAELEAALRETENRLVLLTEESNAKIQETEQNAEKRIQSAMEKIQPKLSAAEAQVAKITLLMEESDAKVQKTTKDAEQIVDSVEKSMKHKLSQAEAKLSLLKEEYKARIQAVESDAEERIIALELSLNKKLAEAKEETKDTRTKLLREKEEALSKVISEERSNLIWTTHSMSQKISQAENEIHKLKWDAAKMKKDYEAERKSFRKLAGLSLNLAKERTVALPKRLFKGEKS